MKLVRVAAIGLAVLCGLALLWLVGGNAFAKQRARRTERAWVESFGTLPNLLKRYPRTATNDTARRLEILARPLGLDLTPETHDALTAEAVSSTKPPEREVDRLRYTASVYLTSQRLEKPEAAIDPPPPEVKAFFTAHANDVRALEAELLASPPPRWDFDPASLPGKQPIPKIDAIIRLQRTLLAMALVESVGQNNVAVGRSLEASWKLNQALRHIPDSLCQIMALGIARLQVGTLRKVDVDADLWRKRLAEQDFKRPLLDTELLFSWPSEVNLRRLEDVESQSERGALARLRTFFLRPLRSVIWSEVTEGFRRSYVEIANSPLSDREVPESEVGPKSTAAEIILSISLPGLRGRLRRVDRFVLDSELTTKVLEARQRRVQNHLEWPAAIPGIEATRFPGVRWIYSVSPQKTMSLSLSKDLNWNQNGFSLPCRFTSS
jgi:hypothetical protein